MASIFGYTLLNDVSARDVQFKDAQITLGKNFNRFAPIGPCIVTTDELTAPDKVHLVTRLNGKTMQNGNTSDWLFPLPRLLSFLSQVMVLEPGDIVTTGTPAGVGFFKKPQVFMKAGDVVEIEGEGIGVLRNRDCRLRPVVAIPGRRHRLRLLRQLHLQSWRDLAPEGVELAAVCDRDAGRAEAIAAEFGAAAFADPHEMMAMAGIDLVDIATRMDTHRELVEARHGSAIAHRRPEADGAEMGRLRCHGEGGRRCRHVLRRS